MGIALALCIAFLAGIIAPETEFVKRLPGALGVMELQYRDLNVILQSIVSEPVIAIDALLNAPELPTIYIDMKYEHFNRIQQKRHAALERGILLASDKDFVPAEIRYEGRTIKVKMRLKGDLPDHRDTEKWSYRIHVKGDDQLFGMRRFSIQHPKTRNFLAEKAWLDNLRLEGVLAPRFQFVNVVFNGNSKGIFALEESFSKELLESQGRREGVILSVDEDVYWQRYTQLGKEPRKIDGLHKFGGIENALISASRSSRIDGDPVLSKERETDIGLLRVFQEGKRTGSEVFDAALLGKFLAITDLWQAEHALIWENIHFYYNPITTKLEPIGFDGNAQRYVGFGGVGIRAAMSKSWSAQALQDPVIAEVYVRELNRVSQSEYLEYLQLKLGETLEQMELALHWEFPFVRANRLWKYVKQYRDLERRSLAATNLVLAFMNQDLGSNKLRIEVRPIVALPVEVTEFEVDGSFIPADVAWTGSEGRAHTRDGSISVILPRMQEENNDPPTYAIFNLPFETKIIQGSDNPVPEVKVETRLLGLSTTNTTSVRYYPQSLASGPIPSLPTVEEVLAQHPFLRQGDRDDVLWVRKGEWDVAGDLILPQGIRLQAGSGTTLRFAPDAILFTTGPLEFRGTENAPIVLAPQDRSWSGLIVLEAERPSVWEYVVVKNTHGIEREGWILTGGVTFYKSPLYLIRSHIQGSEAEDGINVILSPFEFRESDFSEMASDAFDGDFTEGVIYASNFYDIAGDAIDVSGSEVKVSDVLLQNVRDKALSVGENSRLEARSSVNVICMVGKYRNTCLKRLICQM